MTLVICFFPFGPEIFPFVKNNLGESGRAVSITPKKKTDMIRDMLWVLVLFFAIPVKVEAQGGLYRVTEGSIRFRSDAPLENIEASTRQLEGLLDTEKGTFAFSAPVRSFQGFNSPLQREHFNENYLESDKYPKATFAGKIIETIDFSKPGKYEVRAKGKLSIHGREQERIIRSILTIENGRLQISSEFSVLLEEFNIAIPKIVYQKISEEINVSLQVVLTR